MKKLLLSILTIFCIGLGFGQTWQTLTPDVKSSFMDIALQDSNHLYAVGLKGIAYKTENGGGTWIAMQTGTSDHLSSVCTIGGVVYATAPQESKILRSSDGITFTAQQLDNFNGNAVYFVNNMVGFITGGQKGKLAKTTNGGDFWEIITTNYPIAIKKVFFVSVTLGFAIAHEMNNSTATCVILKTVDGGVNWQKIYEEQNVVLNDLHFTDATYGVFVGNNGKLLRTTNGGTSFNTQTSNVTTILNAVTFADQYIGYVVGNRGAILKTSNRGATWQLLSSPKEYLYTTCEFQGNVGYILEFGKWILKTTNGGL